MILTNSFLAHPAHATDPCSNRPRESLPQINCENFGANAKIPSLNLNVAQFKSGREKLLYTPQPQGLNRTHDQKL